MSALTATQHASLQYLVDFEEAHGFLPTIAQLGAHFGLSSPATAHKRIQILIDKGYCERVSSRAGGLRLTGEFATRGLRLDQALRMAGEGGHVRIKREYGWEGFDADDAFTREDVIALGWEVFP